MLPSALFVVSFIALTINAQDPGVATWQPWSKCDKPCGSGKQVRLKLFPNNPVPDDGQEVNCREVPCDDPYRDAIWTECDGDCSGGTRHREDDDNNRQTIPCNMYGCDQPVGDCKADVAIVLDSSASIGEFNWWRAKQSSVDIAKGLKLHQDQSRVGAIMFSTTASRVMDMESDLSEIENTLWGLPYLAAVTSISEGLLKMMELFDEQGRNNVPHISILLTDGNSTVDEEDMPDRIQQLKNTNIQSIVVGITNNINEDELKSIASSPSTFLKTNSYESLQTIIAKIVEETCIRSTALGCEQDIDCDCSCDQLCQDTCTEYCQRVDTDTNEVLDDYEQPCTLDGNPDKPRKSQMCYGPPCTTTTTTTTTTTPPPDPSDCDRCDYTKGQIWLPNDENCRLFWVCTKDGVGGYIKTLKTCGHLYWDNSLLTCVRDPPYPECGDPVTYQQMSTTKAPCIYEPVPNDPSSFRVIKHPELVLNCPEGQTFYANDADDICTCVGVVECDDDRLLWFPFEEDYNDHACHKALGLPCGNGELNLVEDAQRGTVASFGGSIFIEVPFFRNWHANNDVDKWSVMAWVKADSIKNQGIVNNGDCVYGAAFAMNMNGNGVYAGIGTDDGSVIGSSHMLNANQWYNLIWTYDGTYMKLYVDGVEVTSDSATGFLLHNDVPIYFGFDDGYYFEGLMDEVTIWNRLLDAAEIASLQ